MRSQIRPEVRSGLTGISAALTGAVLIAFVASCGSAGGGGSGGAPGSGGANTSGGASGSSGGAPGSGGASTSGGAPGSGGASTSGGAPGSGGASSSGGASGTGGRGTGGAPGTGGGSAGMSGSGGRGGGSATGGRGGGNATGGAGGGTIAGFTLTSPMLTEGAMFMPTNTCAGTNTSPQLDWTAGPTAAMGYAIVLTDKTNNLIHWVLWNIPADTHSLAAMLGTTATLTTPAGARQVAYTGNGYQGPCPSGTNHTYEFAVHAVDAAMLPGVAANATTMQANMAVTMHSLGKALLAGISNARRP